MKVPLLDLKAQYAPIKKNILSKIGEVLDDAAFILGKEVSEFETEMAQYCQVKYAIGCASGSDALVLSLMAYEIGPGDEVITSPYTFFATAGSISLVGAKPVFADIDRKTYNINPDLIEEKINKNTKAIIPVHLYGQSSDMDPIIKIAEKNNLIVIEDAAQAIGAEYKKQKVGSLGDVSCFSFFPSKNLGAMGDGGLLTTNQKKIADKLKILRVHGASKQYHNEYIGRNSRLDAIHAAILRIKLPLLEGWSEKRRENGKRYTDGFKGTDIITPFIDSNNITIYNQYVIRVQKRDELKGFLMEKEIGCALYYPLPLHLQGCYSYLGYKNGDLPESEGAALETISIPVFPELSQVQQEYVIETIKGFYN